MSLVTVYAQGKIVIPADLRKKYRIEKGMKILVEEDPLHNRIILIPIPPDADPLEHFAVKGKLPLPETEKISGEEGIQEATLQRDYR